MADLAAALADLKTVETDRFDGVEVFAALVEAAELVEAAQLDEEGTDAVSVAALVKVLRGGSLPPARLSAADILAVLTPDPQPGAAIAQALGVPVRVLTPQIPGVRGAEFARQRRNSSPMVWLAAVDALDALPADADLLAALSPDPIPVADLAARFDCAADVLARHVCRMDGSIVEVCDDELTVQCAESDGEV